MMRAEEEWNRWWSALKPLRLDIYAREDGELEDHESLGSVKPLFGFFASMQGKTEDICRREWRATHDSYDSRC